MTQTQKKVDFLPEDYFKRQSHGTLQEKEDPLK